jgi:cell division ATPase FtsA
LQANLEDKILFSSSNSSNEKDDLTIKEEEEQQQQEEKQEVPATTLERVILLRITHIFQIINITPFLSFSHYFLYLRSHKG